MKTQSTEKKSMQATLTNLRKKAQYSENLKKNFAPQISD
jgi:hypothetical protein